MKILFFSPYYYPHLSGITTFPFWLISKLARNHQITVLTFKHQDHLPSEQALANHKIIRMKFWLRISKGFISPFSIIHFFRELRNNDLVIINLPNVEGIFLVLMAKMMKKKVIGQLHCQLKYKKNFFSYMLLTFANLITNLQMLLSDSLVAFTSDYIESTNLPKIIKNKFFYALPFIEELPIDQHYLAELKNQKKHNKWVGFVGRVSREKGLIELVSAINQLDDNGRIQLVFAGPCVAAVVGEQAYYSRLISLLKNCKINYQFLGELTKEKLGSFYSAIDTLVLPSTNSTEAFGLVQAEAMLLGAPVVASDLPGVRVPVSLTGMGVISPPGNIKKLAYSIKNIISNKDNFSSKEKVKKAKQHFQSNQIINLFESLIS